MATVVNTDAAKFPFDAAVSAPYFQGENQLSSVRPVAPSTGGVSTGSSAFGQLWPRGQRA